jgi:hypothetical protein
MIKILGLFIIALALGSCNQMDENVVHRYPDGRVRMAIKKDLDKNESKEYWYYPNGTPEAIFNLDEQSIYNGEFFIYYENGNVKESGIKKAGRSTGENFEYYPEGNIRVISHYENDSLHGKSLFFRKNGDTLAVNYYHKGFLWNKNVYSKDGSFSTYIHPIISVEPIPAFVGDTIKISFLLPGIDTIYKSLDSIFIYYNDRNFDFDRLIIFPSKRLNYYKKNSFRILALAPDSIELFGNVSFEDTIMEDPKYGLFYDTIYYHEK